MATGMLTQKIARQVHSVRYPPASGPTAVRAPVMPKNVGERAAALAHRERRDDDRERRGEQQRREPPWATRNVISQASPSSPVGVAPHSAEQIAKPTTPSDHATVAEHVGELAAEHEERGQREQVAVDDPLRAGGRQRQVLLQVGDGEATIVWSMNIIATAKIIATRIRRRFCGRCGDGIRHGAGSFGGSDEGTIPPARPPGFSRPLLQSAGARTEGDHPPWVMRARAGSGTVPRMHDAALGTFRSLRRELEDAILPLAGSLDGRGFEFNAPIHDLQVALGGYVRIGAGDEARLGQITQPAAGADQRAGGRPPARPRRAGRAHRDPLPGRAGRRGAARRRRTAVPRRRESEPARVGGGRGLARRQQTPALDSRIARSGSPPGCPPPSTPRVQPAHVPVRPVGLGQDLLARRAARAAAARDDLRIVMLDPNSDFVPFPRVRDGRRAGRPTDSAIAGGIALRQAATETARCACASRARRGGAGSAAAARSGRRPRGVRGARRRSSRHGSPYARRSSIVRASRTRALSMRAPNLGAATGRLGPRDAASVLDGSRTREPLHGPRPRLARVPRGAVARCRRVLGGCGAARDRRARARRDRRGAQCMPGRPHDALTGSPTATRCRSRPRVASTGSTSSWRRSARTRSTRTCSPSATT